MLFPPSSTKSTVWSRLKSRFKEWMSTYQTLTIPQWCSPQYVITTCRLKQETQASKFTWMYSLLVQATKKSREALGCRSWWQIMDCCSIPRTIAKERSNQASKTRKIQRKLFIKVLSNYLPATRLSSCRLRCRLSLARTTFNHLSWSLRINKTQLIQEMRSLILWRGRRSKSSQTTSRWKLLFSQKAHLTITRSTTKIETLLQKEIRPPTWQISNPTP